VQRFDILSATARQSEVGTELELSDDVLDRIDEIATPGVNINPTDGGWVSPVTWGEHVTDEKYRAAPGS
jgi:hypothetical protein